MKPNTPILLLLSLAIVMYSCSKKNETFESLSKLEGNWSMKFDSSEVMEKWIRVNDTLMEGKSYEITGTDSILTEMVKLVCRGDEIYFIPQVSDQNNNQPVIFQLTGSEGDRYVFENPKHDFPTAIVYHFLNNDKLNAGISGDVNGELRSLEFDYVRVPDKK